jgi:hypothetical protein
MLEFSYKDDIIEDSVSAFDNNAEAECEKYNKFKHILMFEKRSGEYCHQEQIT